MSFGRAAPARQLRALQLLLRFGFFFFAARTVDAPRTAMPRPTNARPDDSARAATRHCSMHALRAVMLLCCAACGICAQRLRAVFRCEMLRVGA